jgi:thioester reductase-like protein
LNNIPINPITGKLNHKRLPSPPRKYAYDFQDIALGKDASRQEQEEVMSLLWERILFLDKGTLQPDSNFFDYGGHSLMAVELTTAIEEIFETQLMVKDIYEYPTIKKLVQFIDSGMKRDVPQISIKGDAFLDPSISPASLNKPRSVGNAASIFITGTTGFLGAFLLEEILRTTKDHVKCYCLVRIKKNNKMDALNRIIDNLKYYQLYNPKLKERIIPVPGDLTSKYFGWSEKRFNEMAAKIDFIFHCASLVNYVYSYTVIKPATVNGTYEILRLACTSATKPIHYISTNGIFPGKDKTIYLENSDIDSFADKLENGYGQAKWVAEKLIWEAVSRKIPVCLYRPGNIGHHSLTGAANPNDFQTMIIDACRKVNCAPKQDSWSFEITPVDFLVKSIAIFAEISSHFGKVYNVVQNNPVSARIIFDLLLDMDVISGYVSIDEWKSRLVKKAAEANDNILNVLAQSLDEAELYLKDTGIYDCSQFERALSVHNLHRPAIRMKSSIFCIFFAEISMGRCVSRISKSRPRARSNKLSLPFSAHSSYPLRLNNFGRHWVDR